MQRRVTILVLGVSSTTPDSNMQRTEFVVSPRGRIDIENTIRTSRSQDQNLFDLVEVIGGNGIVEFGIEDRRGPFHLVILIPYQILALFRFGIMHRRQRMGSTNKQTRHHSGRRATSLLLPHPAVRTARSSATQTRTFTSSCDVDANRDLLTSPKTIETFAGTDVCDTRSQAVLL